MLGLRCDDVRPELQAPRESVHSFEILEEHMQGCADCRRYFERQQTLDAEIRQTLNAACEGRSVRGAVRAKIADQQRPVVRRRNAGHRVLKLAAPLALVAAVVAVMLPHYATNLRDNESSAQVYTPVRPTIAYPLTADPARPSHLLAGAWGRVYESWNAGQTWKPLAPFPGSFAIRDLVIDRTEPQRYLVATNRSIFVSTDAGHHWRTAAASLPGAMNMFLMQDDRAPNTFFVGPSVLWKSTDHGETWFPAGPGHIFSPSGIQALAVAPNDSLYTAIWNGGVAVSHDGGRSWQRRSNGLTSKVFDVAIGDHRLWAAGPSGVYSSRDGGLHWKRTTPNDHFMVTGVLAGHGFVLAGGNGAIYRSVDGGSHWVLGMDGLPPAPYVYGLVADPRNQDRVYASLNSDGIFRSDDGGQTWTAMNTGLPLGNVEGSAPQIVFLRGGVLWQTSTTGSDPGNLTVDQDVRLAAISSDDASVAYVSGTPENWAIRLVAGGGSGARTLMESSGDMPRHLIWSPDTTRLAAVGGRTVYVSPLSGSPRMWTLQAGDKVVGWMRNGRSLLVWDRASHRLVPRSWSSGLPTGPASRVYRAMPRRSPDGSQLAAVYKHEVLVGRFGGSLHVVRNIGPGCRLGAWSFDSRRLLILCSDHVEILSPAGGVRAVALHGRVTWLARSHSALLVFDKGNMLQWSDGHLKKLVHDAEPAFTGK
jgi:photosystem II stability/assembly factor-like uncharacterized protein